jgi:hypothetical protein
MASSVSFASGFRQYKCDEEVPAGNYRVFVHVMEDAFRKMRASVYHEELSSGRKALTATVSDCIPTSVTVLSCRSDNRSFEVFSDMTAQYAGQGGLRYLTCHEIFRSRD